MCIGELGEGECVGELALDGVEVAPYTVETDTHVRLGQIPTSNIICESQKQCTVLCFQVASSKHNVLMIYMYSHTCT